MIYLKVDREIKYYIIHCADTYESMDVYASDIDRWHKAKGWSEIGYNRFIKLDGTIQEGRSLKSYGAHTLGRGANGCSVGVCLEGGKGKDNKSKDTLTVDQWRSVLKDFKEYQKIYPNIILAGHNQFDKRPCPSFDVREYCEKYGVTEYLKDDLLVKLSA